MVNPTSELAGVGKLVRYNKIINCNIEIIDFKSFL